MKSQKIVVSTPLIPLLAVLFIALKLTGHITWSWLWVLAPLWAPFVLVFVVVLFVLMTRGE